MISSDAKWLYENNLSITILDSPINIGNPNQDIDSLEFISKKIAFEKVQKIEKNIYAKKQKKNRLIEQKIIEIKSNKKWLESVKKKAITNQKSLEEQIKADATWVVEQTMKKNAF